MITSMKTALLPLACLLIAGCASTIGERDQYGNPRLERLSPDAAAVQRPPRRLTLDDIVLMSRQGANADQIIERMRATGTRFDMNPEQRAELQRRGVGQPIVDALVAAEAQAQETDRLTAQADRDAQQRDDYYRRYYYNYYSPYYYDSYWGWPRPYVGYGWSNWGSGWYGGLGWSW